MPSAFETTINSPETPRYPELLEEASYFPDRVAIIHSICSLFISHEYAYNGFAISVYPPGEMFIQPKFMFRRESFVVAVYPPDGASMLGMSALTPDDDFEVALPDAVIPRPDNPHKRMLTDSGRQRILTVMRYGSVHGGFDATGYGGFLGIDSLHDYCRRNDMQITPEHCFDYPRITPGGVGSRTSSPDPER